MLNFMVFSMQTTPYSLSSLFLYYRKKVTVQSTKDNRLNYQARPKLTGYLTSANWLFLNNARRIQDPYTFVLYLQVLTASPNCMSPLIPFGRETWFLRHEFTVLSSLTTWGLKLYFYFLQTVSVFAYSAPDGQRKTRFWWQHYHQQRLQQDTNNYSHFTSKSQLRYCNWEELILSLYWICFCDFLILPLLLL